MRKIILAALLLLAACSRSVPPLSLPGAGACPSWGKLPLVVAITEDASTYRPAFSRAFVAWHEAVGRPVFVWRYIHAAHADVLVALGPVEPGHVAETERRCDGGRVVQKIRIGAALDEVQADLVAQHELGHALGLTNVDGPPTSIMHRSISYALVGEWDAQVYPLIWPAEVRTVRALHPRKEHP